ncbi:hypothetical protein D3C77_505840 [compost metagenome]
MVYVLSSVGLNGALAIGVPGLAGSSFVNGIGDAEEFRLIPWSISVVDFGASAEVSIFRSVSTPLAILPVESAA